jgi:hypothetical protein
VNFHVYQAKDESPEETSFNLLITLVIECTPRRNARASRDDGAADAAAATATAASAGWRPREPQCVATERMASIATA